MGLDSLIAFLCTMFFTAWNCSPAALHCGFSRDLTQVYILSKGYLSQGLWLTLEPRGAHVVHKPKTPTKVHTVHKAVIGHYFLSSRWLHVENNISSQLTQENSRENMFLSKQKKKERKKINIRQNGLSLHLFKRVVLLLKFIWGAVGTVSFIRVNMWPLWCELRPVFCEIV